MTTTQSDVSTMSAGDDLDERVCISIEARLWALQPAGPWSPPTALERLRRLLGLPPPHPSIGSPTAYCGPAYSSGETMEESSELAIDAAFTRLSISYPGAENDSALLKCRWFVAETMDELGME